jgi:catechol 2,3-dioxygenase-like lactoylglutathione lyase family enzyme
VTDRTPGITPIIPCNDLDASEAFYNRLGLFRDEDDEPGEYRMLSDGNGCDIHLITAVEGWVVPGRNPFGVYFYTDKVDELAQRVRDDVIEPNKAPEDKSWGMYEFALSDPDGVLVRIGWPTRLRNAH